jgi:hypothetical protein
MSFQTDLYDEMIDGINMLTNRNDLEGETAIALRAATQNAHLSDTYFRDVVTNNVQLPNTSTQAAIDIPTALPGFRGLIDIRGLDINQQPLWSPGSQQIDVVEMGDIYDPEYGNIKNNIAYVSGDKLIIRYPGSVGGYIFEYLRTPQTKRELYNSWIAQEVPAIILYWAAALVLATNGNEEKSRNYLTQVEKFYIPQLKSNFLFGAQR